MFKFIGQIILVLFIVISIFLVKDDAQKYIKNVFQDVKSATESGDFSNIKDTFSFKDTSQEKEVSQPGALVVENESITDFDSKGEKVSLSGIVKATNKERVSLSLEPFSINSKLNNSASVKVDDMFALQYFEHVAPNGTDISDLGKSVGYRYIIIGENLALGDFPTSESIVRAWMNSPGHKANILHKRYTDIGVSVKSGMYKGDKVWIAVQHFGLPESFCPPIDEDLKDEIEGSRKYLDILTIDIEAKENELDNHSNKNSKEYREEVRIYNEMVNQYNRIVAETKEKLEIYNTQVRDFNTCAQG
ncbi:MAG: hypothetical protein ACI9AR_000597 [Flavobacteriaceae bacterium]|jgi:uncharacterized protein YkwD